PQLLLSAPALAVHGCAAGPECMTMAAPAQRQIRRDDDGTARRDDRVLTTQPLDDALDGLRETPKRLSPVWFYDERGSALFEQICELPEYYPTRTEIGILERHAGEMAHAIGPRACIIEPGSGASV